MTFLCIVVAKKNIENVIQSLKDENVIYKKMQKKRTERGANRLYLGFSFLIMPNS